MQIESKGPSLPFHKGTPHLGVGGVPQLRSPREAPGSDTRSRALFKALEEEGARFTAWSPELGPPGVARTPALADHHPSRGRATHAGSDTCGLVLVSWSQAHIPS